MSMFSLESDFITRHTFSDNVNNACVRLSNAFEG